MDFHVRALGLAYIFYGIASTALSVIALILLGGILDAWNWAGASLGFGPILLLFLFSHMLLGIPMIIGGIYLRRLEEWARLLMIVVSALNILNVPIGSALGAYGLWVLLQPETEPLFSDPVFKGARAGAPLPPRKALNQPLRRSPSPADSIPPRARKATPNVPE